MEDQTLIADYKGFALQLDNVIYPEQDYLLQVYYLFAQFMEYNEQMDSNAIIDYMKERYRHSGAKAMFKLTSAKFGIPQTYLNNFELLHQTARLPLKLMLFQKVFDFMQKVRAAGKPLFLLLAGDPVMQLNKVRQVEWYGLENYLKIYFHVDTPNGTLLESLALIHAQHGLQPAEILCIVHQYPTKAFDGDEEINFLSVDKL